MTEIVILTLSLIVSMGSLLFTFFHFRSERCANVRAFFAQGDSESFKKNRKSLYKKRKAFENDQQEWLKSLQKSEDASNVVSFYDFWGLMVKKHYLPKWTFQDSSLYTLRQAWENVKPYVEYRRITQPVYASHFEWLIEKIKEKPTRKN